jgi:hypothetical protein
MLLLSRRSDAGIEELRENGLAAKEREKQAGKCKMQNRKCKMQIRARLI